MKERGLLFHQEQYLHEYPFCWRAEEDPLIQYPRESWFIRTTAFKDEMLKNNSRINWLPEHIKDGRFGKFLESNVDWALSRERLLGHAAADLGVRKDGQKWKRLPATTSCWPSPAYGVLSTGTRRKPSDLSCPTI